MSEEFGIDQKAAVPWFKKASDGGHQEAMFTMAKFYYAGELVATNRGESARLLALVDPKRLPRAPEVLGLMTLAGDGVAKDIPKGISLLETAATNGRAQAATTLGRIYLTGEAVPKDEHKALQWFLRAGELGDARGMAKAGLLCGQANDVTLQKRSRGLIFAALSNNQQAAYSEILTHVSDSVVKELEARNPPLATNSMVQFRRVNGTLVRGTLKELGVAGPIVLMGTNAVTVPFTDLDVAGRTRCDLEFRSLLSRSVIMERIYALVEGFKPPELMASTNDLKSVIRLNAEKGKANYQVYLGSLLLKDRGTATEGIEWLKKEAESGAPAGQFELGLAYYKGTGVPVDKQEAFRLFDLAADHYHAEALLASGQMLIAGAGCLKDEVKGFQRLRESALLWESDAILATGRYLYGDRWGTPDAAQSFAWFRLGSILGMPVAQYWLGRMYYEGKGISADYNRAIQWLSESASQGYQPAADLLNNDAAHKSELAAARQDYLKEQADFSKRLEHIRTNPKYDTIVPAQRIPSAFGNSREKEAYQRFADNYMNRRFSSIGAAVDDAWRNVGRRSHGYASNIQFIRGDLGNERFREAVQGAMQGVIDWSEVEAYSRHGSTESPTSYRPSVSYARSRSYQDEVEQTLWAGWLEAVQAAAMYPDLIQE